MANNNIQQQLNQPNGSMMTSNELFTRFWQHYTEAFFNYNLAQFAELSSQFKITMPAPANIRELGNKALRAYFDEVWSDHSQVRFSDFHPQPKPAFNPPNNARPEFTARPNYEPQTHDNPRPHVAFKRPSYNDPNPGRNFSHKQRSRGQPRARGGPQQSNRPVWYKAKAPKHSFTNLSDDESSERGASSVAHSSGFNKKVANDLGFNDIDDDNNDNNFSTHNRINW
jgi:hypothetical protein